MVKIHSTIANSSKFKKILESFKDIIGEAFFEFKEDGLYIKSIDSSHITLLVLVLKPQFFKDYSNLKSYDFGIYEII
jgi:proliferating cell nuclear antigen